MAAPPRLVETLVRRISRKEPRMRYLYKRGKGARRRVLHLCGYDNRTGLPSMRPICGRVRLPFDTTSNVPFGHRVCRYCVRAGQ